MPNSTWFLARCLAGLTVFVACLAHATTLTVEVQASRSPADVRAQTDGTVKRFAKNLAILTSRERQFGARFGKPAVLYSQPVSVLLTRNGIPDLPPSTRGRGAGLSLVFASDAARQFPADYQTFLQDVFTKVEARLTATFGDPAVGGTVVVSNYDADIGERDAVAGGYYFYDASSGLQEIRFPVYADNIGIKGEVAAVNFVHTLLLAYLGPKRLEFDAYQEGLVRAATMQVVRTAGALPSGLDPSLVEQVLESTYDVGPTYDWNNQQALGGPLFIAPNLRSSSLPIGGSVGGLYLLRYQMAGSAWQKVLVEYPVFAYEFLSRYYLNPTAYRTKAALVALAQLSLDALGGPNSTIEGLSFASWARRQSILDTSLVAGSKLLVQPFAIASGLSGSDFGVFGIQAHYFRTAANGNETLLKDTSYPIYFSPDFTRIFTAAQDDRMDIFGAYGSVAPNFPGSAFNNEVYRVTVDVPVQDRIARSYLPAGAIATAARPVPNNVYGCITGAEVSTSVEYSIRVSWGAGNTATIPVKNMAFGSLLASDFDRTQRGVLFEVLRTSQTGTTVALSRKVNKGPGELAVNLHIDADQRLTTSLSKGINMVGLPGSPYEPYVPETLGLDPSTTLAARWEPEVSRFNLFPDFGDLSLGHSLYLRAEVAKDVAYEAFAPSRTPVAIALKPGWNMVVNPLLEVVDPRDVMVYVTNGFARTWDDAVAGSIIGSSIFSFFAGATDPVSGAPETGTLIQSAAFGIGQAVFVQVLSADGATLLFPSADFRGRSSDPTPAARSWEMSVALLSGSESASARLGQSVVGSLNARNPLNVNLPPGLGGLQVSLRPGYRLYREVRAIGRADTYTLTFEGLRPGEKYTVDMSPLVGKVGKFVVWDQQGRFRKQYAGAGSYTFTAKTRTRTVRITVAKTR